MPTSAQAGLSGGRQLADGSVALLVGYPPRYDVSTYIGIFFAYFDKKRFYSLPISGSALTVLLDPGNHDMAIGACRKWLKLCG